MPRTSRIRYNTRYNTRYRTRNRTRRGSCHIRCRTRGRVRRCRTRVGRFGRKGEGRVVLRSCLGRVGGRTIGCHRCGGVGGFHLKVVNKEGYNIWIDSTDGSVDAKYVFLKSISNSINESNQAAQSPQQQRAPILRDIHCPALGNHLQFAVSDAYDGTLQLLRNINELTSGNLFTLLQCRVSPKHSIPDSDITLHLVEGDIVNFIGDVIVNAANEKGTGGGGVDGAITAAGGTQMQTERENYGSGEIRIPEGHAVTTTGAGGDLKCTYVVHTCGPNLSGSYQLEEHQKIKLACCYISSLWQAEVPEHKVTSVAFPLLSAGIFRGNVSPKKIISTAIECIYMWAKLHPNSSIKHIYMYAFDKDNRKTQTELANTLNQQYLNIKDKDNMNDLFEKYRVAWLVDRQLQNLPRALLELNTHFQKTTHWAWWAFPTNRKGHLECKELYPRMRTSITTPEEAMSLLYVAPQFWWKVLEAVCTLADNSGDIRTVLPSIDLGRVKFFVNEWTDYLRLQLSDHEIAKRMQLLLDKIRKLVNPHYRFFGPNKIIPGTGKNILHDNLIEVTRMRVPEGCINAAYQITHKKGVPFRGRVGIMVAANSGLPGGKLGNQFVSNKFKIHANYRPQEEDVVSAWLNSINKSTRDAVFKSNLFKRWGLIKPIKEGNDAEYDTLQGINYNAINTIQDMEKYGDAWVVKDVSLSCKTICGWQYSNRIYTSTQPPTHWDDMKDNKYIEELNTNYNKYTEELNTHYQPKSKNYTFREIQYSPYTVNFATMIQTNRNTIRKIRPKFEFDTTTLDHADLFFVAAPNSNKGNTDHGSMARTLNTFSRDYRWNGTNSNKAHIKGVEAASRAALDAMIEEGITHAFLVGIGAGVYYNKVLWTEKLHLERIFNEILKEDIGPLDAYGKRAKRGQFFEKVYYITL